MNQILPSTMLFGSAPRRLAVSFFALSLLGLAGAASTAGEKKEEDPFARWKPAMAEFAERDAKHPPESGAVLFVGSSSIRMWDLEKSWPDRSVINNGFGGSVLADSIHFFDQVIAPYDPSAIVIYCGDNDVSRGNGAEQVLADFDKLAGLIRKVHPEVPVIYIAIKPSVKRWDLWPVMKEANRLIAAYCGGREGYGFADIGTLMLEGVEEGPPAESWFMKDGLHLSEEGYAKWTELVDKYLPPVE